MSGNTSPSVNAAMFTEIPLNLLVPGTYLQVGPIYSGIGLLPAPGHILIVAQMLATGSAIPLKPYPLLSAAQATNLSGAGSIGELQAQLALAAAPYMPIDIIFVADATGAAQAQGEFTLTGAPTVAGVLPLYVAGISVPVPVAATDTPISIAANAVAQMNAMSNPTLPVQATVGISPHNNAIAFSALHGGLEPNNIRLEVGVGRMDVLPHGLTCTVTEMSGGTLNPSIAAVITAIQGKWYTDIIIPWQDAANFAALAAELTNRYNSMVTLDAHAYSTLTGTYGAIVAAAASLNSRFMSVLGVTNPPTPAWGWTAAMGAACAQRAYNDPSLQSGGLVLAGIVGPRPADRINETEQQLLLSNAVSTFDLMRDGTVVLQRVVTTNLTDNTGTATVAWQDFNAPRVASRIRYDFASYLKLTYPSNKLADDGSLAAEYDPTVATPKRLLGSWAARCNVYGKNGWIEDIPNQVGNAVIVRDPNSRNRVNASLPYQRIGNLMIFAGALQFEV